MHFIDYLADNDHIVFAALCHVFSRQIERAMAVQADDAREYQTTCREAPKTKLKLYVPHNAFSEIEFAVKVGGRQFELVGICEINGQTTDRPHLSLNGHDYHYRVEHSRLIHHVDFNEYRTYDDERAYDQAVALFEKQRAAEKRALDNWWKHVQQSEVISRLQVS